MSHLLIVIATFAVVLETAHLIFVHVRQLHQEVTSAGVAMRRTPA